MVLCIGEYQHNAYLSLRTEVDNARAGAVMRHIVAHDGAAGGHGTMAGARLQATLATAVGAGGHVPRDGAPPGRGAGHPRRLGRTAAQELERPRRRRLERRLTKPALGGATRFRERPRRRPASRLRRRALPPGETARNRAPGPSATGRPCRRRPCGTSESATGRPSTARPRRTPLRGRRRRTVTCRRWPGEERSSTTVSVAFACRSIMPAQPPSARETELTATRTANLSNVEHDHEAPDHQRNDGGGDQSEDRAAFFLRDRKSRLCLSETAQPYA